ncbi:ArsR/SmtB family transcription factor [Anaerofustis stercorihominis]|uniref:ArsR/SmtB family transcription factor n=1 Tax=Anaerofustis stercorihominis TaxID=214853 RepID=UPI00214B263E|nr:winged helix-turn-helix domain-containing protein [Anaerofustis stercorihominis]MCR2033361.1 winged helix-turn-helix domain-containing protein [Anaerofustis stercorihominis]
MNDCKKQRLSLSNKFKNCKNAFVALGDETRQSIIVALLESDNIGMRVGEITKKTYLSRPAVSHHLKILKEANIISMYKKGTMNFYYISTNKTIWNEIKNLTDEVYEVIQNASAHGYPDEDQE